MKAVASHLRFWLGGTTVAILGVIVARWIAPGLNGTGRLTATMAGQSIALAGLFILCLGVRRRLRSAAPPASSNGP